MTVVNFVKRILFGFHVEACVVVVVGSVVVGVVASVVVVGLIVVVVCVEVVVVVVVGCGFGVVTCIVDAILVEPGDLVVLLTMFIGITAGSCCLSFGVR